MVGWPRRLLGLQGAGKQIDGLGAGVSGLCAPFARAGPKQGQRQARKWPSREVPAETSSGYATHQKLGGHVVVFDAYTVLYLAARGLRRGSSASPAHAKHRLSRSTPSSCLPATCFCFVLWLRVVNAPGCPWLRGKTRKVRHRVDGGPT